MASVGKRVLVSGMGGELGTRVASLLEEADWVREVAGLDLEPPRGRLRHARFHRVDPRDRRRTAELIAGFDPHVVLHLGVYEPNARAGPASAARRTDAAAVAVLGAAAEGRSLEAVVVRSGIEVYGRRRGSVTRPDESAPVDPTTPFGRSLAGMEQVASDVADAARVPVTVLRLAPVLGPHVPSPLGRYLRLPVVPVDPISDPAFAVLHVHDAAEAIVAAARSGFSGPVNVVAEGAVTPVQAVRMGNRLPWPVHGPGWWFARPAVAAAGAPAPDHLVELLTRGRVADPGLALSVLGLAPALSSQAVIKELYRWASVTHLRPIVDAAA